jgi:D-amino-acid dehydrogenase
VTNTPVNDRVGINSCFFLIGNPRFWIDLCPATPTNIPYIGKTKVNKLWVNAGHGTLGWAHDAGSGKSIAELINGKMPNMRIDFYCA